MTLLEISQQLHQELGNPTDIAVGSIKYFLRQNLGTLNNFIGSSFSINLSNGEVNQDISENEASILKKIYLVHFYESKQRNSLGSAAFDPVIEVDENGAKVRIINKNELSKTYSQAKKDEIEFLKHLVSAYKLNQSSPLQVAGADTVEGIFSPSFKNVRDRENV